MTSKNSELLLQNYIKARQKKTLNDNPIELLPEHSHTYEHLDQDQKELRDLCLNFYTKHAATGINPENNIAKIKPQKHANFAQKGLLDKMEQYFTSLDASRTWMCFWSVHTLNIVNNGLIKNKLEILNFLKACYNTNTGGFGGGPGQMSHLAPTYSATNCIASLDIEEGFQFLKEIRASMVDFLAACYNCENGSFVMHRDGETDTRAVYCAISVMKLLKLREFQSQISSKNPEKSLSKIEDMLQNEKTFNYLISCQTYEGGFAAAPGNEAHGGFTWCSLAAIALIQKDNKKVQELISNDKTIIRHLFSCLSWLARRQCPISGGFNGRTNKLVDACYSFWQGSCFSLLENYILKLNLNTKKNLIMNSTALAGYITACCQGKFGGLRDKPGKYPDYYHTSYGFSGYVCTDVGKEDENFNEICPLYNLTVGISERLQKHLDL